MHGILAIDPFVLAVAVLGAIVIRGWFRVYAIATIVFTTALAIFSISYVSAVIANQPTPWMGLTERASQYAMNLWYAVLAGVLLRQSRHVLSNPQREMPSARSSQQLAER
jgi:hypothetical protein